jgi:predicted dinucleotide-binding enzyme
MKVGVIGSGDVGKALAKGFRDAGHEVMIGSREPGSTNLKEWTKTAGKGVAAGTFEATAKHGQTIVLAVVGHGLESAIDLAGPKNFTGKLVLDATNPLDFSHGMPPGLFLGTTDSLGERVQRKLPDARVVKCFNTVSNAVMVHPKFPGGAPEMLICGNDAAAKAETEKILKSFGWPGALDVGGIEGARWLEALVPLWVRAGATLNTYGHAFKVVKS